VWERERRKHTIQGGESVYVRGVCGVPRRRGGWPRECRVNRPVNSVDSASRLQSSRVTETTLRRAGGSVNSHRRSFEFAPAGQRTDRVQSHRDVRLDGAPGRRRRNSRGTRLDVAGDRREEQRKLTYMLRYMLLGSMGIRGTALQDLREW